MNERHSLLREGMQFPICHAPARNLALRVVVEQAGELVKGPKVFDFGLELLERASSGCVLD
ncbi:hypothetical protein [Burkholderia sp. Ac-20392]|uniref:hypothetical protein n=1 Tax=Burkholderia sp. Ac-20392 TaxID=2703905 RepID=UPI00197E4FD1|nr:hypothetical protein [Burkholderia sp. Ac-20392]MBN3796172.1 hypothetical protein [Burkholderia sp. Ac-20392]